VIGWIGLVSVGGAAFTLVWWGAPAIAARLARPFTSWQRWADESVRALHLPTTARRLMAQQALIAGVALLLGLTTCDEPAKVIALGALGVAAPVLWVKRRRAKRKALLDEQLDGGLQMMANSILATQNLVDGFDGLARHAAPPLSEEAELVVKEVRVGASIDDALAHLAARCQSRNVDAVVTALAIGRRTGGNLPKVLELIARVLRETMRVEGLMAAKTSEGKASGWLMAALPILFGLVMQWIDPEWMAPLFNDPIGTVILGIVCVLEFAGAVLVRKASTIDA
jgi:tight adherence protein B